MMNPYEPPLGFNGSASNYNQDSSSSSSSSSITSIEGTASTRTPSRVLDENNQRSPRPSYHNDHHQNSNGNLVNDSDNSVYNKMFYRGSYANVEDPTQYHLFATTHDIVHSNNHGCDYSHEEPVHYHHTEFNHQNRQFIGGSDESEMISLDLDHPPSSSHYGYSDNNHPIQPLYHQTSDGEFVQHSATVMNHDHNNHTNHDREEHDLDEMSITGVEPDNEATAGHEEGEVTYNTARDAPRLITINDHDKNTSLRIPSIIKIKPLPMPSNWSSKWHMKQRSVPVKFVKRKMFPDNRISTTQYWWWHFVPVNFVPLNLFYQFRLVYNWYFILVMVFSLIPGVSPVFPITAILPVIFIFGINMIKDFTEDLRRYLKDRQTNRKKVHVLRGTALMEMSTGDIQVGDIVSLSSGATIPADMVILSTSNQDNKCYVETAQLDGETNMKPKFGKHKTQHLNTLDKLVNIQGELKCNPPVIEIHKFDAVMKLHDGEGQIEETLHDQNIILKGCTLKNTAQLYGIVVYTGEDTKIMLNTAHRTWKMSFIDIKVNIILLALILIHQVFCVLFVVLSCIKQHTTVLDSFYIVPSSSHPGDENLNFKFGVYRYFTFFILLNLMIPMSLFVSLQFIKVIQAYFMERDIRMYYEEDDIPMEATASDLNADLARIDIIFSDKTGTLTNNTMVFKKMGIGDRIVHSEADVPGAIGKHLIVPMPGYSKYGMSEHLTVPAPRIAKALSALENLSDEEELRQRYFMMNYMLNMVICNELIVEDGEFSGESPDEICLAEAALQNGFRLINQSDKETEVEIFGRTHLFPKIHTIKFTSDRKKMSVISQFPQSFLEQFPWFKPAGYDYLTSSSSVAPVVCYTKGADSSLYPLIRKGSTPQESEMLNQLVAKSEEYIDHFGVEGLRTLLLCHRFVDARDADVWRKRYIKASAVARNPKVREARMSAVEKEMESDFDLDGATAIEDKLQEYVPETIRFILAAGIQFWVLTGDKRETAKNVAQLAGLVHVSQSKTDTTLATGVFDIDLSASPAPTEEILRQKIQEAYQVVQNHKDQVGDDICLVINGVVVGALETFPSELNSFLALINMCKTVIVCRAIPAHKASVVRLVQKNQKKNGLAIGDGANDVSMIQSATVGIGISGKEGSQARNAADYALPRFFHLKRLLAVHGHYSLTRLALFVQYSFYKNIVLTFAQIFYTFYCIYSGQTIIDSWVLTFYNMIFTLAPPFVIGLFDKDVDETILEDNPQLYKSLKRTKTGFDQTLSFPTFTLWVIQAIYHAAIIFFIVIYAAEPTSTESMQTDGIWVVSTIISVTIFIVVNIKVCMEMRYITILNHLSVWLSVILFFSFMLGYSGIVKGGGNMFFIMFWLMSHGKFYLIILVCVAACLVPDLAIKAGKKAFFPAEWEVLKEKHHEKLRRLLTFGKKRHEEREQEALEGPILEELQHNIELSEIHDAHEEEKLNRKKRQKRRPSMKQQHSEDVTPPPATVVSLQPRQIPPPPADLPSDIEL